MFNFKRGVLYDITYLQIRSICRNQQEKITINLKKQMYYKQTEYYYVFWNSKEFVRILKKNLITVSPS